MRLAEGSRIGQDGLPAVGLHAVAVPEVAVPACARHWPHVRGRCAAVL
jgi:hypothetical protein